MTNLPSREELEQAIHDYGNAISDEIDVAWDVVTNMLDSLYSPSLLELTRSKLEFLNNVVGAGIPMTINEVRTNVLGWEPLPPDDCRGDLPFEGTFND